MNEKQSLGKYIYIALILFFATVFVACAIYILNYVGESGVQGDQYSDLSQLVEDMRNPDNETLPTIDPSNDTEIPQPDKLALMYPDILPEYRAAYFLNNDLVGWITVPGTSIDYPVVQSSEDNANFYLNHNFYKETSRWGCIYAREACDVFTPSDNVVLYGHHMRDGSMFAQLDNYKKADYWQEHQTFTFNTIYEYHTYQIIAVFKTSANIGQGFSYHIFDTASSEEEFNEFISTVHELQFYDTGITAEYGDMLLTLSTCEYTLSNGRFVVVAKRID